jgi:dihydroxyacid dehydratase/phosphogluconate dehydratase
VLDLLVSDAELAERRTKWQLPPKEKPAGCLGKCAAMATSAGTGAILKWRYGGGRIITHGII